MSDAVRPLLDTSGVVFADHDQFVIADEVTDTTDARAKGSLLEVGPGFCRRSQACRTGLCA